MFLYTIAAIARLFLYRGRSIGTTYDSLNYDNYEPALLYHIKSIGWNTIVSLRKAGWAE